MAQEGTNEDSWKLKIPPFPLDFEMYKDEKAKEVIGGVVGKTTFLKQKTASTISPENRPKNYLSL